MGTIINGLEPMEVTAYTVRYSIKIYREIIIKNKGEGRR